MNVLLVEDDSTHATMIRERLRVRSGAKVFHSGTGRGALAMLEKQRVEMVFLDYSLPDSDGLEILGKIRKRSRQLPVVFLTAADSAELCAQAFKLGAIDYVVKKRDYLERLPGVLSEVTGRGAPVIRGAKPDSRMAIVGTSASLAKVRHSISRAAAADANVLIEGETGTGKELVARAIHDSGPRAGEPFVAINCATIPEHLFESELFGHVRGAFTGAVATRQGLLEQTREGSFFMDEVEALTPAHQAKLLRVLQSASFRPVGCDTPRVFGGRVIAASNEQLAELVHAKRMRQDLFYRLNVLHIEVPPLRKRREDIGLLLAHFVKRYEERTRRSFEPISAETVATLRRYRWPGNVRELENLVERALVQSDGKVIDEGPLLAGARVPDAVSEREALLAALARNQWSRERSAAELGISRITLWRRMKRHGVIE